MGEDGRGFVFKICVVGNGAVGKTSLIQRYTEGEFNEEYIMTLGAQFTKHETEFGGVPIELVFWDIAGQESFAALRKGFYKGSRACIVVFSHEDNKHGNESFDHVKTWLADIQKNCGFLPIIIFGNKSDLAPGIKDKIKDPNFPKSTAKVNEMMKGWNFLGYITTSALSGDGVKEAFNMLSEKLYEVYKLLG